MPLRVKNGAIGGGSWVTPDSGDVALKWTGASWIRPSIVRVKSGALGGGSWIDSDYRGYPGEPRSFAINGWNYNQVSVKWAAPLDGAPVTTYNIQMRAQNGVTVLSNVERTTSPSLAFNISHETRYQFFIRARGANNLYSDWVGPIRVQIGKPAETYQTTETGVRDWSRAESVNAYRDQVVGPWVPTAVRITSIRYQINAWGSPPFTSALSPFNNREIMTWNNAQGAVFNWGAANIDTVYQHNYVSDGGRQGMICRGAGWTTSPSGTQRATGTITVYGRETYSYQQTHTIPAVANTYW